MGGKSLKSGRAAQHCSSIAILQLMCFVFNHKHPLMFSHSITLRFCSSDLPGRPPKSIAAFEDIMPNNKVSVAVHFVSILSDMRPFFGCVFMRVSTGHWSFTHSPIS